MEKGYVLELIELHKKLKNITEEELIQAWKYYHKNFNPFDHSADYIEAIEEEILHRMKRER